MAERVSIEHACTAVSDTPTRDECSEPAVHMLLRALAGMKDRAVAAEVARDRLVRAERERDEALAKVAAVEALADLADRLNRAADALRTKARDAEREGMDFEAARLRGKTEGVRLAWSYVEEHLRGGHE